MTILFGHPTGNPNSHQAALAHFEVNRLSAFCVPWMPTPDQLRQLQSISYFRNLTDRLQRRCFDPLLNAPKIEGKLGEWLRMIRRIVAPTLTDERISYEANDWLMRTMRRACRRPNVGIVHSYEDCSLWQFEEAKKLGKVCVYDMPIGYYEAWEEKQRSLALEFIDWLPSGGLSASRYARPEQKRREMGLADLVLVPSMFVLETIRKFHPDKQLAIAPYGVDLEFWIPSQHFDDYSTLRFLFAGQISIRKGIPVLAEAWRKAALKDAQLDLVGSWNLAEEAKKLLPPGINVIGPCSRDELRRRYQATDVFVLPSYFEGFALVGLEAMACGLPIITTEVMAGMGLVTDDTGRSFTAGDIDGLVESLRWFAAHRDSIPMMKRAARSRVEKFTWGRYRNAVREAVTPFVG